MPEPQFLRPDWPAPASVGALVTTRIGGVSVGPWRSFNLAEHVGDAAVAVRDNRLRLLELAGLDREPLWLEQVHGTRVVAADSSDLHKPEADASTSSTAGRACVVMTADCLPVLFCNRQGTEVAAAHAGWRGLAAGVLRNTLTALRSAPEDILAFLGPAISQPCFEVGAEVRQSFLDRAISDRHRLAIARQFMPAGDNSAKLLADLYGLARAELGELGVRQVFGGNCCTWRQPDLFYSFRREGITGRMAALVWLRN